MQRLVAYPWPGNVRELQNVIERAVVLSPGPVLDLDRGVFGSAAPASPSTALPPGGGEGLDASLEGLERRRILEALDRTRGVIEGPNGAARLLQVHPNTLRSRMERLGIERRRHETS
jgi:formate hydrogenlyase transcriptional activator